MISAEILEILRRENTIIFARLNVQNVIQLMTKMMTPKLRPYQIEAVEKGLEFFKNGNPKDIPIIVAPTGAGKSIYIGHIANELKEGVLVLQPSKELLEQNYAKYRMYGGEAAIYSASMGIKEIGHVTFATIGSLKSKAADFQHVKHVIIDECHLVPPFTGSMFTSFLSNFVGVKILGMTATPFRLKSYNDPFTGERFSQINMLNRERPRFFNYMLHVTQISELYDQQFLAPIKYIEMAWDNGKLTYNSTGAEFSDESVDRELKQQRVNEKIPSLIKLSIEKGRKHRVVFVKNVSDAIILAQRVPHSACIHASTKKKERETILRDFKVGRIKTVFNVGVLTIGFDFPALDTIIIARPTMSLALYMQMIGRGIRCCEGKTDCAVVDMCGNMQRFSKFEDIKYHANLDGKWAVTDGKRILSGVKLSTY